LKGPKRLCFVTYELHPVAPGGVGSLLAHALPVLLERGHEVTFLVDFPPDAVKRFRDEIIPTLSRPDACTIFSVDELAAGAKDEKRFGHVFLRKSWILCRALEELVSRVPIDFVEFFDFNGPAYHTIVAKHTRGRFARQTIAVRAHLSCLMMDSPDGAGVADLARYVMYRMEEFALEHADVVLAPSEGVAKLYGDLYDLPVSRFVPSPSPISPGDLPRTAQAPGAEPDTILYFARLWGFKGPDEFVDACAELMRKHPDRTFRACLAGTSLVHSPLGNVPYWEYLKRRIPPEFAGRIEHLGFISRDELAALLPRVICAVFPTRAETFCYGARELALAGVPVVVSDHPALADYFADGVNCLVWKADSDVLADKIEPLLVDEELRRKISENPRPPAQALGDAYERDYDLRAPNPRDDPPERVGAVVLDFPETGTGEVGRTVKSLAACGADPVLVLHSREAPGAPRIHIFGRMVSVEQPCPAGDSNPLAVVLPRAMAVLAAGDVVDKTYCTRALELFRRDASVAAVGSYHRWRHWPEGMNPTRFPLDAAPEAFLVCVPGGLTRYVVLRDVRAPLQARFQPRFGACAELAGVWQAADSGGRIVTIHEELLEAVEIDLRKGIPKLNYLSGANAAFFQFWSGRMALRLGRFMRLAYLGREASASAAEPSPKVAETRTIDLLKVVAKRVLGRVLGTFREGRPWKKR